MLWHENEGVTMPRFNEWGLLPAGHEGPRDSPMLVASVLVGPVARASNVVVGGHAPPSTPEAAAREQAPPNAPEVAAGGRRHQTLVIWRSSPP